MTSFRVEWRSRQSSGSPGCGSRTIISASSSCCSSSALASGSTTASSVRSNAYLKTDARRASSRSRGGIASTLALTTACTVGGTVRLPWPSAPAPDGMSMPVVSMMKYGFPPARSAISSASTSPIRPPPEQLVARERDDERAASSLAACRHALDEIEHRRLQGVRVLENDQHRVVAGEPIDHGRKTCLNLMDEGGLIPALAQ